MEATAPLDTLYAVLIFFNGKGEPLIMITEWHQGYDPGADKLFLFYTKLDAEKFKEKAEEEISGKSIAAGGKEE